MSKYPLIPGMEAFLEDTEVNVEVEVGAPEEVVEEQEETAEAAGDIEATETEAEATEEQTEMILTQFAMLERQYNHVKQYGADRTFMRLFNSNGELERAFRLNLPSCESFDATGDKSSAESRAIIAGMEGALSTVWEFLKNLCRKIARFFGRLIDAIRLRFGNLNKAIGRLREALKDRKDAPDLSNTDAKTIAPDAIKKAMGILDANFELNQPAGTVRVKNAKVNEYITKLTQAVTKQAMDQVLSSDERKKLDESLKAAKDELKDIKNKFNGELKDDGIAVKDIPLQAGVKAYLDGAAKCMQISDDVTAVMKTNKALMEQAEKAAGNMVARKDDKAKEAQSTASAASKVFNFQSVCTSTFTNCFTRVAGMAVRAAATRLRYTVKAA